MPSYRYRAEIVRWVDGDTVDVVVDLGFKIQTKQRLRLFGVNTPERGKPGFREATEYCEGRAPQGSTVEVSTYKTGKFGRWLADVFVDGDEDSVNKGLLETGHAVEYLP